MDFHSNVADQGLAISKDAAMRHCINVAFNIYLLNNQIIV